MGHTPWPWMLESPEDGGRIIACDDRHTIVYEPNCSPFNEEERANAKLFFSAPVMAAELARLREVNAALLEACKAMLDIPTEHPFRMTVAERERMWAAHRITRAAITKATGTAATLEG